MLKKFKNYSKVFKKKKTPKGTFEPELFKRENAYTDHSGTVGNNY
jgi:hypothetical protein